MSLPNLKESPKPFDSRDRANDGQPNILEIGKLLAPVHVSSFTLWGIFLLLVLAALKLGSDFLIPVMLAFLLSFLFAPVVRSLHQLYVPLSLGAAIVLLVFIGTLTFGIYRLALPATGWMAKLPQAARQLEFKLSDLKQTFRDFSKASREVERITKFDAGGGGQQVEVKKSSVGEIVLGQTQGFLIGGGLMLILLFFLLASGDMFLRKLVTVLPRFEDKKLAVEISRQIEHDISRYLGTVTLINAGFGAAVGTTMYFLDMPNPLLWGVMAGSLHFIPFLGALVGISIVALVALVTFDQISAILLPPSAYLLLNLLEEWLIFPFVIGHRLLLNPVVVFIWLIFWGWLWGIAGALMAVPLLAIFKIVCDHLEPLSAVSEFLAAANGSHRVSRSEDVATPQ
jgi:predicted PurR-regulated permease PerM